MLLAMVVSFEGGCLCCLWSLWRYRLDEMQEMQWVGVEFFMSKDTSMT
jgi:hypothetical protein